MSAIDEPMLDERVVIALGANLGDPPLQIRRAFERLCAWPALRSVRLSPIYRSQPWGITEQPEFANAVVCAECGASPLALLDHLREIELQLGRIRGLERNGPRLMDLDLIVFGQRRLDLPELTLPHPRVAERAFVLKPWLDLEPQAVLPGRGPVQTLLAALPASDLAGSMPWR